MNGCYLKLVLPHLPQARVGYSLPGLLQPVLQTLAGRPFDFVEAELSEGEEWGVFVSYDRGQPAPLCQQWLVHPGDTPDELEPVTPNRPVHVNLMAHDNPDSLTDLGEERSLRLALDSVEHWLEATGNVIRRLTLMRSSQRDGGVSVGVEAA